MRCLPQRGPRLRRVNPFQRALRVMGKSSIALTQNLGEERHGLWRPRDIQCHHHVYPHIPARVIAERINQILKARTGILCELLDDDIGPRALRLAGLDEACALGDSGKAWILSSPTLT